MMLFTSRANRILFPSCPCHSFNYTSVSTKKFDHCFQFKCSGAMSCGSIEYQAESSVQKEKFSNFQLLEQRLLPKVFFLAPSYFQNLHIKSSAYAL